ncbi:hypothetical protein SAMN00120144_4122 [Hymenobacter roseosalivarius DSM 11622]|uniref:Uncharacterized protein n=1 Tax=Hymenobacter roseosalivarius DSM 11622 TaxID=645990 RepID=A0A1W1UEY0_9BACT|nr:hypothetical protein SAMN00120144_4122 [Hymenobacter roseosalivarius DSM 11622]
MVGLGRSTADRQAYDYPTILNEDPNETTVNFFRTTQRAWYVQ